ncbi:MAG: hypothetical protein ACRD2C_06640 [Acidimicrobiales bacterium]
MSRPATHVRSRLRPADVVGLGLEGLRAKRTRSLLTALGIAIGIAAMVLVESMLLAGVGGVAGVALGAAVTWAYANARDWGFAVPISGLLGGLAASIVVGALAGLYPAARASGLAPVEAVRAV